MLARLLASLALPLALAAPAAAQDFVNVVWPPRDIGSPEVLGRAFRISRDRLVTADTRAAENDFLRVYDRAGLNWRERGRLTIGPRKPVQRDGFGVSLDLDGEFVVAGADDVVHVFRHYRGIEWRHELLSAPDPTETRGFGALVSLSGEWLAVATDPQVFGPSSVYLLHRESGAWRLAQRIDDVDVHALELEGETLVLSSPEGLVVYRRTGDAWDAEFFAPAFEGIAPRFDLAGDRIAAHGVLTPHHELVLCFERSPTGWRTIASSGTISTFNADIAFNGTSAFVAHSFSFRDPVVRLDLVPGGWGGAVAVPSCNAEIVGSTIQAEGELLAVRGDNGLTQFSGGPIQTYAFDGRRATLRASSARLSLQTGGVLTLALDAGVANAGKPFFLGGSLSGTSPGFRVGHALIPLERRGDVYAHMPWQRGVLDGLGRASVDVVLPAVAPGEPLTFLKDRTLQHVFVIWEHGRGITHVSNVAPTAIVGRAP